MFHSHFQINLSFLEVSVQMVSPRENIRHGNHWYTVKICQKLKMSGVGSNPPHFPHPRSFKKVRTPQYYRVNWWQIRKKSLQCSKTYVICLKTFLFLIPNLFFKRVNTVNITIFNFENQSINNRGKYGYCELYLKMWIWHRFRDRQNCWT